MKFHGLLLQVRTEEELISAARSARSHDIQPLDAYTPYPVEGLSEALGKRPSRVPWIMLICGILGALAAFGIMTFSAVAHYPFNVGGRPLFSWPAFVPITFEVAVLSAAIGGALSLAIVSGLPRPNHPVFNDERYRSAAQSGFFLMLPDTPKTRSFLADHYSTAWKEVEP